MPDHDSLASTAQTVRIIIICCFFTAVGCGILKCLLNCIFNHGDEENTDLPDPEIGVQLVSPRVS